MRNNKLITKPILKWVGGKTQIIDKITENFPAEINNYREVFLGGGSVLLSFLSCVRNGTTQIRGGIFAYDLNAPLISVYKNIQSRHEELYEQVQQIIQEFNGCGNGNINRKPATLDEAKENRENYYYWTRLKYNQLADKNTVQGSAMFIFLNKTCFRGVFRMGPNGFNVPYGHYNSPEILNKAHLDEIHQCIQPVVFECKDFSASLSDTQPGDFVYLDPPYAPENSTSFVGYTEHGFGLEKHQQLFAQIHHTTMTPDVKIMMSNADVQLVRDHFSDDTQYTSSTILCKRSINSKNPEAKTKEVIIKNY